MKRMLFNATYAEELRVAAVEGQKLINFDIETSSKEQRRGNIYKGLITRVEPSLEACFVDYGTEKQGFLPFKEIDLRYAPEVNGQKIRDFAKLPLGTELIVQVEKDERGNKGAALTSYITLPGRYLVLMPNNSRAGGISRRIEGEEREELKSLMSQLEVPQGMSIILRTAALGRVIEELKWDLTYLLKLWGAIRSAAEAQKGAFLIYQESSLVIRSIRDHFSPDISEILIDTEEVYDQARQFMAHVMPNFADRIKFYRDDVPLFSRFQIEHQIESAYSRVVNLPSGGAIVIDHTEALTSVDVNSAKANKGADIEATAFVTNIEAAEEVARQLRLRDLGGLVVVDFIDMENLRNQRELENHFKLQLGLDRARIQMGKLSKFGLLELSRQRLQASLDESSTIACPRCSGVGSIRGIESSALHVLRIVQEEAVRGQHLAALHVQLPVDVATYLLNERRDDVAKIEARMKVRIMLIPNVHLDSPNYKIRKLTYDNYESSINRSSYDLVEVPEETLGYKSATKKAETNFNKFPVVQNISTGEPAPLVEKRSSKTLFSNLVKRIGQFFAAKPVPAPKSAAAGPTTKSQPRNLKSRPEHARQESRSPRQGREAGGNTPAGTPRPRSVTVSKSNPRIQTVRPTPPSERTSQAEASNKPRETLNGATKAERNPRQNSSRQAGNAKNEATGSTRINNLAVSSPNSARPTETRKPPAVAPIVINDKLNIAQDLAAEPVIFAANASGAALSIMVQPSQEASLPIALDTLAPVKSLAKPRVAEAINLGNLQLITTNQELLNSPQPPVELAKVKRFSDLVIEERVINPNLNYELVETRQG